MPNTKKIKYSSTYRNRKKKNHRGGQKELEDACSICHDVIENINCCTTTCRHSFHLSCYSDLIFSNRFLCPLCRSPLYNSSTNQPPPISETSNTLVNRYTIHQMKRIGFTTEEIETYEGLDAKRFAYHNRMRELRYQMNENLKNEDTSVGPAVGEMRYLMTCIGFSEEIMNFPETIRERSQRYIRKL